MAIMQEYDTRVDKVIKENSIQKLAIYRETMTQLDELEKRLQQGLPHESLSQVFQKLSTINQVLLDAPLLNSGMDLLKWMTGEFPTYAGKILEKKLTE